MLLFGRYWSSMDVRPENSTFGIGGNRYFCDWKCEKAIVVATRERAG